MAALWFICKWPHGSRRKVEQIPLCSDFSNFSCWTPGLKTESSASPNNSSVGPGSLYWAMDGGISSGDGVWTLMHSLAFIKIESVRISHELRTVSRLCFSTSVFWGNSTFIIYFIIFCDTLCIYAKTFQRTILYVSLQDIHLSVAVTRKFTYYDFIYKKYNITGYNALL